jgi:hypothetical protein
MSNIFLFSHPAGVFLAGADRGGVRPSVMLGKGYEPKSSPTAGFNEDLV